MTARLTIQHHGDLVAPSPTGCYCGMVEEVGVVEGGDCRSLGCDPCCPTCGGPDDECPDPATCGGRGRRGGHAVMGIGLEMIDGELHLKYRDSWG